MEANQQLRPESDINLNPVYPSHRSQRGSVLFGLGSSGKRARQGNAVRPERHCLEALGHPYVLGPRDCEASPTRPSVCMVIYTDR
jgi:hypothetical protein